MAHAFDNQNFMSIPRSSIFPIRPSTTIKRNENQQKFSPNSIQREQIRSPIEFSSSSSSFSSPAMFNGNSQRFYQEQKQNEDRFPVYFRSVSNSSVGPSSTRFVSTNNKSYFSNSTSNSPTSFDRTRINPTYMATTQLYIGPPYEDEFDSSIPPPPPPRQPFCPPTIPPRNSSTISQRNSITIPDFNAPTNSTDGVRQAIYRSPVYLPNGERENQTSSLLINTSPTIDESDEIPNFGQFFGDCAKCGKMINSTDDPCDVLGRIYHSSCAVCIVCGRSVKNKYFYLKDDLYCEEDFLYCGFHQNHEQCVVCQHLITETIIQALGNSYHSACFKCSKCSKSLDGLPFVIDQHKNLYCLSDYHVTYGPRCYKCSSIILPEQGSNETVRIVSMGKNFHLQCYRCEDCSIELGDEEDRRCFPLNDRLFCQECCHRRLETVHKF